MFGKKVKNPSRISKFLKVPKRVQDCIHIDQIDISTGVFYHGKDIYTKQFTIDDVNFETLDEEDKEVVFEKYCALINSFASGGELKITLNNRHIDSKSLRDTCFLDMKDDGYDYLRKELNGNVENRLSRTDGIDTQLIFTIRVNAKSFADAEDQIARQHVIVDMRLKEMGTCLTEVSTRERLRLLYSFFHAGEEWFFDGVYKTHPKSGKLVLDKKTKEPIPVAGFDLTREALYENDFKTVLSPSGLNIKPGYVEMLDGTGAVRKYARTVYVKEYATFVSDNALYVALGIPKATCLSIDVSIVDPAEALKMAERSLDEVEKSITKWQMSQNKSQNFSAEIPYKMRNQRDEVEAFVRDLNERDQCMCMTCVSIFLMGDTLEELDNDTKLVIDNAQRAGLMLTIPKYQQMEGLNTAIPLGCDELSFRRMLTTESLAIQMPFKTQNIMHKGGTYYGINPLSKKIITANRFKLINHNEFILGASGSGKSVTAKLEILATALKGDTDILIIDPEREYNSIVAALGGERVILSSGGQTHLNAMECSAGYGIDEDGQGNPIAAKSEYIQNLIAKIGGRKLSASEKSIIDRAVRQVMKKYAKAQFNSDKCTPPTLNELKAVLEKFKEDEAHNIAIWLEQFTEGSLDLFAQQSTVDINSNLICFDMYDLGPQLKPLAMLVTLDFIQSRIAQNRKEHRKTAIYIDEIYLLFQDEGSEQYLMNLWKRARKYAAYLIGITQNIGDLLMSMGARNMLQNSEFIVLLSQAAKDKDELAKMLHISEKQLPFISSGQSGEGLLKVGSSMIPFENKIPVDGEVFKLVTTTMTTVEKIADTTDASIEEE